MILDTIANYFNSGIECPGGFLEVKDKSLLFGIFLISKIKVSYLRAVFPEHSDLTPVQLDELKEGGKYFQDVCLAL